MFEFFKAWSFNRRASSPGSKPEEVLRSLALREGESVIDVGVGGGFYALKFAELVGSKGIIYGVDVNPSFLKLLADRALKKGLQNIKTVPASQMDSLIPLNTVDCIFLRNVYHHLDNRVGYFRNMSRFLKPGGRIAIIEYKAERKKVFKPAGHYTSKDKIVEEMTSAGYKLSSSFDFLPEQSFTIFSKS